jgi:hypothetical protein
VISRDGEAVDLAQPLKARLQADHWVKCIGTDLRHLLRSAMRRLSAKANNFFSEVANIWMEEAVPVQVKELKWKWRFEEDAMRKKTRAFGF